MEFTLDLATVRRMLRREKASAAGEMDALGIRRAFENSQARHDVAISSAPDVDELACDAGCSWCCYFTVDVRAVEVFSILDYIEATVPPEEKARLGEELRANSAMLMHLGDEERAMLNVKCPFLVSGRCMIYPVRPQTCRNYHATDAAGCRQSYEEPGNSNIDPEFAPGVYQAGAAHVDAVIAAMTEAGYDIAAYELNCALDAALRDPGARGRFEAGKMPFVDLRGEHVPAEFDDLLD